MKEKLIKLLSERIDICLTQLPLLIPEIKGEYSMYAPFKPEFNQNVIMLSDVSQDWITLWNELTKDDIIEIQPCSYMVYLMDGAPYYSLDVFSKKLMRKQKHCWLPILLKKGKNFKG